MNSLHDRSGKLALELVERNSDASAPTGLNAFHHGVGLIAVLARHLHDAGRGLLLDPRRLFQRFGDGRFRKSADFSDFLQRDHFFVFLVRFSKL